MGRFSTSLVVIGLLVAACSGAATPTASPATPAPTAAPTAGPTAAAKATPHLLTNPPTTPPIELTAAVAFDGQACTYAGPKDIPRGARLTFTMTNTAAALNGSQGAALVIAHVVDGTTWDKVVSDTATRKASDVPSWIDPVEIVGPLYPEFAATGDTMSHVMVSNLYLVMCATAPQETDKAFPAILLKVVDN